MDSEKPKELAENSTITQDSLFDGALVCRQHRSGYRFSIDSVLLAHSLKIRKHEHILDLGTGCGIIGLLICYRHAPQKVSVTGLEMQPDLAALARWNSGMNGYASCFSVIEGNLAQHRFLIKPEAYGLVTANPPFHSEGSGRLSRNEEAMAARHQGKDGLSAFVEAASYAVKNRGKVVFIYPAQQVAELLFCFKNCRIAPKKMQMIYSYPTSKRASLVVVEGVKNGGPSMEVLDPLYIYRYRNGPYSDAVEKMFRAGEFFS